MNVTYLNNTALIADSNCAGEPSSAERGTIQRVLEQYEESSDKLIRLCQAWHALLLSSRLHAVALAFIRAQGGLYDVQLLLAGLSHHPYHLHAVHL